MLKIIIFTSLLVCVAIAYAADANEPQKEHNNKHNLEHSKQLGEHQHGNLEQQEADEHHAKHKKNGKNTLNKSEHGVKHHHSEHGKVKATGQAPRRLRKPQREPHSKKNGDGKAKLSRAGEARTAGQKRKHAKHGHEGHERTARGRKVHQ